METFFLKNDMNTNFGNDHEYYVVSLKGSEKVREKC